ncbi:MAG: amidohydrolase family protein [Deltaproteobacteria bacterium]|uniref:Amidohydrolase family protein n=1 Tax=Candidatus Zymogenus saltonus TaxID=2844893 RepID=A0A9D8PNM7_9DELT|nr:amidohydrolase family protein [Candidatus Zymogenus saltonus]
MRYPGTIIDAHVHIMPPVRIRGLMRWIKRAFPEHPVDSNIDEEGILNDLKDKGISLFFNYVYPLKEDETEPLNEFNLKLSRRIRKAAPFGSLHIETKDKGGVVKRCIEQYNHVGLKFHPFVQKFGPADERMFPVYELMEEYERPVVLHTGFEEFYGIDMPTADFEKILGRFPKLPLVLSHCLFPKFDDARMLVERYDNVYLDATNVFGSLRLFASEGIDYNFRERADQYSESFRDLLLAHSKRTIYGSDHPAGIGDLNDIYNDLFNFGLPDEVERYLVFETPRAFIRRFSPEISARWDEILGD